MIKKPITITTTHRKHYPHKIRALVTFREPWKDIVARKQDIDIFGLVFPSRVLKQKVALTCTPIDQYRVIYSVIFLD